MKSVLGGTQEARRNNLMELLAIQTVHTDLFIWQFN